LDLQPQQDNFFNNSPRGDFDTEEGLIKSADRKSETQQVLTLNEQLDINSKNLPLIKRQSTVLTENKPLEISKSTDLRDKRRSTVLR